MEWIEEIRIAMEDIVPNLTKEEFKANSCDAGKIISGKKNWSAPGPNRITNFWWKKAHVLHEGGGNKEFSSNRSPSGVSSLLFRG